MRIETLLTGLALILLPAIAHAQALSGLPNPGLTASYIQIPNASSTGTTLFTLTKLTGAPSTAIISGTSDTAGVLGVAVNGVGTSGSVLIQINGLSYCVFDGATTAGDSVTLSSSATGVGSPVAGNCHDSGFASPASPPSGQVVGTVLSTNATAGTYVMRISTHHLSRMVFSGNGGSLNTANTFYFNPVGGTSASTTQSGTTQAIVAVTGTIENLQCAESAAESSSSDTFTLMSGTYGAAGSASNITCNNNSGQSCSDLTHTLSVTAGQALEVRDVTTGTTARVPACSFDLVF